MPFKFKIKNASTSMYMLPLSSLLNNDFINDTIRGSATGNTNDAIWVSADNPIPVPPTTAPMRFYNPAANIYLGDTEQFNVTQNYTGTVAGSPNFTTPSMANKWFLQSSFVGQYKIFCQDAVGGNNPRRLVMDATNQNRVIITSSPFNPTNNLGDSWLIELV